MADPPARNTHRGSRRNRLDCSGLEEAVDRERASGPFPEYLANSEAWTGVSDSAFGTVSSAVRSEIEALLRRRRLSDWISPAPTESRQLMPIGPAVIEQAAALAMEGRGVALAQLVDRYADSGWPLNVLLLDLLTPAVRLIGVYWAEDRCDFATCTTSTALIERVMYGLTGSRLRPAEPKAIRALVAVTPGDQHVFGAALASEVFRTAGCIVVTRLTASVEELCAEVTHARYDFIALSLARTSLIGRLAKTIDAIRAVHGNRSAPIVVGGRVFVDGETTASDVGADRVVVDGSEMIGLMDELSTFVAVD